MWWLKCHCVEPRLLAGWHGARCARITNATQTQKNPNSASATAQPPSPHPRPPPRRSHSHPTGDQTSTLLRGPPATAAPPPQDQGRKIPPTTGGHVSSRDGTSGSRGATLRSPKSASFGRSDADWPRSFWCMDRRTRPRRRFESRSGRSQLTVTHFMSSALKKALPPSFDSRRDVRRSLPATPPRPSPLPSLASAPLFLILDAITPLAQPMPEGQSDF